MNRRLYPRNNPADLPYEVNAEMLRTAAGLVTLIGSPDCPNNSKYVACDNVWHLEVVFPRPRWEIAKLSNAQLDNLIDVLNRLRTVTDSSSPLARLQANEILKCFPHRVRVPW